jgi:signal peptidase I
VRLVPAGAALAAAAAFACAGAVLLRTRLIVVSVHGISMAPALNPGDRLLVRRGMRPRRGDVVVVRLAHPSAPGAWSVKRVTAVAGDRVPPGVPGGPPGGRVPAGQFVVLGDNAGVSLDSRELGPLPADRLVGVARRRVGRRPPAAEAAATRR